MSGAGQSAPIVDTTRTLKRKQFDREDQDELDALDDIVKRIKIAVPRTPYILTTPSLYPYRYHSQQEANAWMLGRLWRHDEEHVQYRTYLYREPCQDCFELQAGEDDEPEPERPKSQASNASGPPKKKMNLSAFKVKHANGTVTPGAKTDSPNPVPSKDRAGQTDQVSKSEKPSAPTQKAESKPSSDAPRNEQRPGKATHDTSHIESRPRAFSSSQKSGTSGSKANVEKSDPSNSTPHGLPPMLSPVHETLGNPHGLPNILSPTLPSNVQAELDRLDEVQRKRANSDASASSSEPKSQQLAVPDARAQKADATPKSEGRIRSVSVNGKPPNGTSVPPPEEEDDSSLLVKLKFSKTKASTVKNILRLPAKRPEVEKKEKERHDTAKDATDAYSKIAEPPVIKKKPVPKVAARRGETTTPVPASTPASSAKPAPTTGKVGEKRPRIEDDASLTVPAKRPRAASSTQDRPNTPLQQTLSPAPSSKPSTQKTQAQYATPKKEPKAISMLRGVSSEGLDATPGRSGATPAGVKVDSKGGPTSAPLNNKKQVDISLLGQTSAKLNQMGRALKHEATKILTTPGTKITKQEEKRAAVTNLECILAYMAAYYAQDLSLTLRGRPGEVEQTWKTLFPLCLSYARCTKDLPHLDGLRSYLCSMIASAICTHVSLRCSAATAKSHDSPQEGGGTQNIPPPPSSTPSAGNVAENFSLLADHTIKMHRHFQDARFLLPFDVLQNQYKKTFAARESNLQLAREPETIKGARLHGPFFLPLGADTSPIQGVRFGLRFLDEYCEREGVEYVFRVRLGGE